MLKLRSPGQIAANQTCCTNVGSVRYSLHYTMDNTVDDNTGNGEVNPRNYEQSHNNLSETEHEASCTTSLKSTQLHATMAKVEEITAGRNKLLQFRFRGEKFEKSDGKKIPGCTGCPSGDVSGRQLLMQTAKASAAIIGSEAPLSSGD